MAHLTHTYNLSKGGTLTIVMTSKKLVYILDDWNMTIDRPQEFHMNEDGMDRAFNYMGEGPHAKINILL